MTNPRSGHIVIDCSSMELCAEVVELHSRLIPYGPVPRLGTYFMRHIYYPLLISSGWLRCDAYCKDGKVVGFLASQNPRISLLVAVGFGGALRLLWGIFLACACSPRRVSVIWELLVRESRIHDDGFAVQLLSFAVGEQFRQLTDHRSGKRVSNVLFEKCVAYWQGVGQRNLFCHVKRANTPMLLFYNSYGATIRPLKSDPASYEVVYRTGLADETSHAFRQVNCEHRAD